MFEKTTVAFVIEKYILLLWNPKSDYLFWKFMYYMLMLCGPCLYPQDCILPWIYGVQVMHCIALPINIKRFCHITYNLMFFYIFQSNYKYLHCVNMQKLCYGHVFFM
jgi:hypothetical protein